MSQSEAILYKSTPLGTRRDNPYVSVTTTGLSQALIYPSTPRASGSSSHSIEPVIDIDASKSFILALLPREVMEIIFKAYVYAWQPFHRSSWFRGLCSGSNTCDTPLTLGHVCATWRQISLSMPSLWTRMYAIDPHRSDLPLLDPWLTRSSPRLPDITFVISNTPRGLPIPTQVKEDFLAALLNHSSRWHRVALTLPQSMESVFRKVSSGMTCMTPQLVEVDLKLPSWSQDGLRRISQIISSTTHLRRVRWDWRIPYGHYGAFKSIPWSNLKVLSFQDVCPNDLRGILRRALRLEVLVVDGFTSTRHFEITPSMSSITLQHLQTLNIRQPIYDLRAFYHAFMGLQLPSLSSLHLTDYTKQRLWEAISNLVRTSGCRICTFSWSTGFTRGSPLTISPHELSEAFSTDAGTFLEHVVLGPTTALKGLNQLILGGHYNLFSNLKTLEIHDYHDLDFELIDLIGLSRPNLESLCVVVQSQTRLRQVMQKAGTMMESSERPGASKLTVRLSTRDGWIL